MVIHDMRPLVFVEVPSNSGYINLKPFLSNKRYAVRWLIKQQQGIGKHFTNNDKLNDKFSKFIAAWHTTNKCSLFVRYCHCEGDKDLSCYRSVLSVWVRPKTLFRTWFSIYYFSVCDPIQNVVKSMQYKDSTFLHFKCRKCYWLPGGNSVQSSFF